MEPTSVHILIVPKLGLLEPTPLIHSIDHTDISDVWLTCSGDLLDGSWAFVSWFILLALFSAYYMFYARFHVRMSPEEVLAVGTQVTTYLLLRSRTRTDKTGNWAPNMHLTLTKKGESAHNVLGPCSY